MMTAEYLTALSALGTLLVITVSAIAALIQLRHIRSANQLAGVLRYTEWWESPQMQSAIKYVNEELAARLRDPEYRGELLRNVASRSGHPELVKSTDCLRKISSWTWAAGSSPAYGTLSNQS